MPSWLSSLLGCFGKHMAPQQWCFFAELAEQAAGRIGRPMALQQSWHFAVSQDQLGSLPERIGPLTAL